MKYPNDSAELELYSMYTAQLGLAQEKKKKEKKKTAFHFKTKDYKVIYTKNKQQQQKNVQLKYYKHKKLRS